MENESRMKIVKELQYKLLYSSQELRWIVSHYFIVSSGGKSVKCPRWVLPSPLIRIYFDFSNALDIPSKPELRKKNLPLLMAPVCKTYAVNLDGRADILALNLRPGVFFSLFQIPANLFKGIVPLKSVIGAKAELFNEVFIAQATQARIRIIETALKKLAEDSMPIPPRITAALKTIGKSEEQVKAEELYRQAGLSRQNFNKEFIRWIGINPKQFCAIGRFRRVYDEMRKHPDMDIFRRALAAGYYDHAHFLHEFAKLRELSLEQVKELYRLSLQWRSGVSTSKKA